MYNDTDDGNQESTRRSDGPERRKRAGQETIGSAEKGDSEGGRGGKMGRQEEAEAAIDEAIDEELRKNPPTGMYDPAYCTFNVMQEMAAATREHAAFRYINGKVQRRLERKIKTEAKADTRQGLLALPGFELISPWVRVQGVVKPIKQVTLGQHRESVKDRAARIKHAEYPRWSEDRMKRELAALVQERKLDRKLAPLTGGNAEAEMGAVMEQHLAALESPRGKRDWKGGKARQRLNEKSTT